MADVILVQRALPLNLRLASSPTDLAYLAGMIDADGFISIQRTTKANNGRCKPGVYHCLKVGIAGTSREPHDFAAARFGGNIQCYKPKNERHLPQFFWQATGPTAVAILKSILPYMLIKTRQADLGLRFQAMIESHRHEQHRTQVPPYRITAEMAASRDDLWKEMKSLNKWRCRPKKSAGRLLDGREWNEMPERQATEAHR